jgi:hypothetical protein
MSYYVFLRYLLSELTKIFQIGTNVLIKRINFFFEFLLGCWVLDNDGSDQHKNLKKTIKYRTFVHIVFKRILGRNSHWKISGCSVPENGLPFHKQRRNFTVPQRSFVKELKRRNVTSGGWGQAGIIHTKIILECNFSELLRFSNKLQNKYAYTFV